MEGKLNKAAELLRLLPRVTLSNIRDNPGSRRKVIILCRKQPIGLKCRV